MGLCLSRPDITDGAIIVDSVVISNSRVRFKDNIISIPIKSLASGESSVLTVDRKEGRVHITRGSIHGTLSHDSLLEEIDIDDQCQKNQRRSHVHRETLNI